MHPSTLYPSLLYYQRTLTYSSLTLIPQDPQKRLRSLRQSLIRQLQMLFPSLAADQTELLLIFLSRI
ncbi:unnamed protein product [Brassica oleracea var. botrytis]